MRAASILVISVRSSTHSVLRMATRLTPLRYRLIRAVLILAITGRPEGLHLTVNPAEVRITMDEETIRAFKGLNVSGTSRSIIEMK